MKSRAEERGKKTKQRRSESRPSVQGMNEKRSVLFLKREREREQAQRPSNNDATETSAGCLGIYEPDLVHHSHGEGGGGGDAKRKFSFLPGHYTHDTHYCVVSSSVSLTRNAFLRCQ